MPKLKGADAPEGQAEEFKPEAKEKKEGDEASSSGDEGTVVNRIPREQGGGACLLLCLPCLLCALPLRCPSHMFITSLCCQSIVALPHV